MYHRPVVAIDLEDRAQAAALVARARSLSDAGAEITLLHVLDDLPAFVQSELPDEMAQMRRARAMVELRALMDPAWPERVAPITRAGGAAGQIIAQATETGADLILLASHKPGLRDLFLGSTASRVVRHAPCSVLVKRSPSQPKGQTMYSSIVIAAALFNEGATTRAALERARLVLAKGGKVTLVHVLEEVPGYIAASLPATHVANRKVEVTEQLRAIAAEVGDFAVDVVIEQGQPAACILDVAENVAADLIMIASHKPGLSDYFIGSTAARVVRHAQTSVLVSR
jgi:nucleotide-binding universal stress UspA family protein